MDVNKTVPYKQNEDGTPFYINTVTIKATPEQMYGYFDFLKKKVADHHGFFIKFGRHVLKLTFPNEEYARRYEQSLRYVITDPVDDPDGSIHYWTGEIMEYLPMKEKIKPESQWLYEGEAGSLLGWCWNGRLNVYDNRSNSQYVLIKGNMENCTPPWHPFRFEFHDFAKRNGYLFLHSAAVGIGDTGVMISATGGSGKSTTVLGALLDGMDYVSDDYLIWDKEEKKAYPLYNCGILNIDSLERIPELKNCISHWVPNRKNRAVLDLSAYTERFVSGMKIKAVICPSIPTGDVKPEIIPDPVKKGKMQMAVSTTRQNGHELLKKDPGYITDVMMSLKDLPCYEFRLSKSREENTQHLKNWIKNL